MLDAISKSMFHGLARIRALEALASRVGMAKPTSFARRFIAGETLEEAVSAARTVQASGMAVSLDQLGESVTTIAEADAATRIYLQMVDTIVASGIERNISLKLSQLGLDIDRATCSDNLRQILEASRPFGFFVRIDMEASSTVDVTLDIFRTVWEQGTRHVGLVLQSALYRSEQDAKRLCETGVRIRLVKGAYKEPKSVAYQKKADVDAAYIRIMEDLLRSGVYPAFATHDPAMINAAKRFAAENRIGPERYEFQMLFGIRRDLQAALLKQGYRVRVYIPFGKQWFPYFMRRLGERPANLGFVVRAIIQDR